MLTALLFAAGLALLVLGAELLVRGASRLAAAVGISPLVIGLTVVAYGTSAPELAVAVQAGIDGRADLAVGNVVGSNIANVLLVLGLCGSLAPLVVRTQIVQREVPLMIVASLVTAGLAFDDRIGAIDGALLATGMAAYTIYAIAQSRRERSAIEAELAGAFGPADRPRGWPGQLLQLAFVAAGLALLVVGAGWLVESAVAIAEALGMSEVVIGLTVVAVGTSLPELATSVLATVRGERDLAIGNVIGSNLYNLLAILGIASLVTPGGLEVAPSVLRFDLPVMLAVSAACLPIFFRGHVLDRWEGILFLFYYAAYTTYLVLDAVNHDALPAFSLVMIAFVVPITALTIVVLALRHRRGG